MENLKVEPDYPSKCPYIRTCKGYWWACPTCIPAKAEGDMPSKFDPKEE